VIDHSGVEYNTDDTITVHGVSPSCQPYAIEITDPHRAMRWANYLHFTRLKRRAMGSYSEPVLGSKGGAHP
jgi:hypothetical protein